MENPEEILHSLEEFSKMRPKDIPRELEEYLSFVAKTGDPVYQWPTIKSLFREKMINVITEFYETCPSVEIPPCPNVDIFNYDVMKNFILEKLDTFAAAPFTVQRICELLTSPRKEYNRIDKYMRALEKNVLVVSTTEPGGRRTAENGEGVVNGLESEHLPESSNSSNDINVEEMDDAPTTWPRVVQNETVIYQQDQQNSEIENISSTNQISNENEKTEIETVITCRNTNEEPYVSIEPVPSDNCVKVESLGGPDISVTITAIPAGVQKRRSSVEPVVPEATEPLEIVAQEAPSSKEIDVVKNDEITILQEIKIADSSSDLQEKANIEKELNEIPALQNVDLADKNSSGDNEVALSTSKIIEETEESSENLVNVEIEENSPKNEDCLLNLENVEKEEIEAIPELKNEEDNCVQQMEVDEVEESKKCEDVVKAEATSGSLL